MDMDFATSCPLVRPALPRIRFLFVGSRFCSTLPSDGSSRFRPCASLVLHLHQVAQGTFTPRLLDMPSTQAAFGDADVMTMQEAGRLFPPHGGIVVGERYRVDRDVVHALPFNPRDRSTWGKGGTPPLLTFDGSFGGSHCLIFAGSGGFKTTGSVIPTALTWAGPIVCFDPSTEIVPLVRGHRRDGLGRAVYVLDPAQPLGFDVTDWIKTSRKKEQDIATLALWLLAESPRARTGADIYFHNQAHNLLTGLLTHVLLAPEYAASAICAACASSSPPPRKPCKSS